MTIQKIEGLARFKNYDVRVVFEDVEDSKNKIYYRMSIFFNGFYRSRRHDKEPDGLTVGFLSLKYKAVQIGKSAVIHKIHPAKHRIFILIRSVIRLLNLIGERNGFIIDITKIGSDLFFKQCVALFFRNGKDGIRTFRERSQIILRRDDFAADAAGRQTKQSGKTKQE